MDNNTSQSRNIFPEFQANRIYFCYSYFVEADTHAP